MKRLTLILFLPIVLAFNEVSERVRPAFETVYSSFREAVEAEDLEKALEVAEPWLEDDGAGESQRAALRFGLGLLRGEGDDHEVWPEAVEDFQSTSALAGPGELRLFAQYDAGVVELFEGERQRALLPEISGQNSGGMTAPGGMAPMQAGPGMPGGPGAPAAGDEDAEDPLELAREAYGRARSLLTERLRSDWKDVDTRANLELIQRRLKELDDIEKQREEQKQEQQDQQDQEGDENEEQDSEDEGEKQDQEDKQDGEGEDEQEQSQEDPEGEDAEENPEPEEGEGEEEEAPEPEEMEAPEGAEEEQSPSSVEEAERHLTKEEVMQLLDQLAEIEEQARQMEASLRKGQRRPVARDW